MVKPGELYLRYDPVAVTLHWVIAICIIVMIPLGLTLDKFPIDIRFAVYALHKSIGIMVLALSMFRLIWRLLNPPPPLPDTMTQLEKFLAQSAHWVLYFLMVSMPLTGWLMVSAKPKFPTVFFWFAEVPFIPMPQGIDPKATHDMFQEYHLYLAYGAMVLITLHVAAALKHHFVEKDTVLLRMLPKFLHRRPHA